MVCLDADPASLESSRETMLDRVAWLHVEISVMEPLAITGGIDLDTEGYLAGRAMGNTHLPLVIETNQERV